jgi:hypothetical protein
VILWFWKKCIKHWRAILRKISTHLYNMILQQLLNFLSKASLNHFYFLRKTLRRANFFFLFLLVSNGYIRTFLNKYPINFNVRSPSHASTVLQSYIFNDLNLSYSKKFSFIFIFSWESLNSISHQINFHIFELNYIFIKTWF